MNFFEIQRIIGNNLNASNLSLQEKLYKDTSTIRMAILPVFSFEEFKEKENTIEYALVLVFNKLYSMLISTENVILLNDACLLMYVFRYNYELYIKIKYLLDDSSPEKVELRVKNFLEAGQKDIIKEKLNAIKDSDEFIKYLKNNHNDFYKKINSIVHPNIESLKILIDKNSNDLFNFIEPSVKINLLMVYKIIEAIYNKRNILKFNQYPNFKEIKDIIDKY